MAKKAATKSGAPGTPTVAKSTSGARSRRSSVSPAYKNMPAGASFFVVRDLTPPV
jgi:hypothetical protein